MLQIIQYQKTGDLSIADLPSPQLQPGGVLVRNVVSVISSGTERTSVETAQASMVGKARSRPDLVRQVLDNVRKEGISATYEKVQNRLDNYKELGYSSAGIVVRSSVPEFREGDRVACAGVAYHAEEIFVPRHLVAKVPDAVPFEAAAFATIGAIAMQGVRQAEVHLGETVAVIGVGLLGLLTIQLLKAAGCRVIGLDIVQGNFPLAVQLGCDAVTTSDGDSLRRIQEITGGQGTDAVILTAGSKSSEPLNLAMAMARKRSKVVIVGAVGMELKRSPFYEKEIDLRISCSYGPGRYDSSYEIMGHDYPIGYVRWTENRNMEAILDFMGQGKLNCSSLITHRFPITEALNAYDLVTGKRKEKYLGIILQYPVSESAIETGLSSKAVPLSVPGENTSARGIGFVGAGNFAQSNLLPYLVKRNALLTGVVTISPAHAQKTKDKFGFQFCSTDHRLVLDNPSTKGVFIATRHDSHARLVADALGRGKFVFVEKPLAITYDELTMVRDAWEHSGTGLMTGFNRRFSKPWNDIRDWFAGRVEPLTMMYRINAGSLPANHWSMAEEQGGRIIGEVCHFIDCMHFVTGAPPSWVYAEAASGRQSRIRYGEDVMITVSFRDGSVGTIAYLANGDPSVEKEYCEITAEGKTAILHNYKEVAFFQNRRRNRHTYDGTKGHREEVEHFLEMLWNGATPLLPPESQFAVTMATLKVVDSLRNRCALDV